LEAKDVFYHVTFKLAQPGSSAGHSVFSSPPQRPMTKDFLSQIWSITLIFLSLFLRKSQYFPF